MTDLPKYLVVVGDTYNHSTYKSSTTGTGHTVSGGELILGMGVVGGGPQKREMPKPMPRTTRGGNGRNLKMTSKQRVPDRVESNGSRGSDKYAFSAAGPAVSEAGAKIVGKSLNNASQPFSATSTLSKRAAIATNHLSIDPVSNEHSLSDITSAADQFNSYRFDENTQKESYKKMMTLHLKDEMFRKLKFITSDDMLDFSREGHSICSYVCTNMRVSNYQWSDYWNMVKKTTKKMIENQRTNATSAVKKGFRCKLTLSSASITYMLPNG